jgi:predicted RNA-binding Zn-ribbon protein involved in translation (DUF1610 family)
MKVIGQKKRKYQAMAKCTESCGWRPEHWVEADVTICPRCGAEAVDSVGRFIVEERKRLFFPSYEVFVGVEYRDEVLGKNESEERVRRIYDATIPT